MAITGTTELDDSLAADYDNKYLIALKEKAVWDQFVRWAGKPRGSGDSFKFLALEELPVSTTALPEKSDPTPMSLADSLITVTWDGYGGLVETTDKVEFQSQADVRGAVADIVANHQVRTIETLIRNAILGGTFTYMPNNLSARTSLDATSDLITYARLREMVGRADSMGLSPFEGETYVAIVHPLMISEIEGLTEFKERHVYRGGPAPEKMFKGEQFEFAGIRWIKSKLGKLYLSGGTVGQAATTLSADAAAGATSITVASATGLTAGDWITVGTLEADDAEQVQITAVATSVLTIVGAGNAVDNRGLKYAHLSGIAVTEAANVGAIPIIGLNSVKGVYAEDYGRYGKSVYKTKDVDLLDRLMVVGWKWFGGVNIFTKLVLRGEFAVTGQIYGNQM